MAVRIKCSTDSPGVTLPNGWALEAGDIVVIDSVVWKAVQKDAKMMTNIVFIENTTDDPTPVPSWRDHQRAAMAWETGDPTGGGEGPGSAGDEGLSAYEVAVANGFIGSETDWLAALVGPPGDPGDPGEPGLSAYQIAVLNGFPGTEADWLLSLQGKDGSPGGGGADSEYVINFAYAIVTWNVNHGLGKKYVDVVTVTGGDLLIEGEVDYIDTDNLTIHWYYPTSGTARVSP